MALGWLLLPLCWEAPRAAGCRWIRAPHAAGPGEIPCWQPQECLHGVPGMAGIGGDPKAHPKPPWGSFQSPHPAPRHPWRARSLLNLGMPSIPTGSGAIPAAAAGGKAPLGTPGRDRNVLSPFFSSFPAQFLLMGHSQIRGHGGWNRDSLQG